MTTLILQQKTRNLSIMQKMLAFGGTMQLWIERHQQRKVLAKLEAYQLRDLGLEYDEVAAELAKPFWK